MEASWEGLGPSVGLENLHFLAHGGVDAAACTGPISSALMSKPQKAKHIPSTKCSRFIVSSSVREPISVTAPRGTG